MGRAFWRSDVKRAIWSRLSPWSQAIMLDTLFPNLSDMILHELIIGDRLFRCAEITQAQILYYNLQDNSDLARYACKNARFDLLHILRSINNYKLYLLDAVLSTDDVNLARKLWTHCDIVIYRNAVDRGAWKIAEAYESQCDKLPPHRYLQGALIAGDFETIDRLILHIDIVNIALIERFDVLRHIQHYVSVPINEFIWCAKTAEDANYVLQLIGPSNYQKYINACISMEAHKIFAPKLLPRQMMVADVEFAKYLLSIGQLDICLTWQNASLCGDLDMLILLKNYVSADTVLRHSIVNKRMRLVRFALSLGAGIHLEHFELCRNNNAPYIFKFLYQRISLRDQIRVKALYPQFF